MDFLSLALAGTGVYPSPLVVSNAIVALFEKRRGNQNKDFCRETRPNSLVVWNDDELFGALAGV